MAAIAKITAARPKRSLSSSLMSSRPDGAVVVGIDLVRFGEVLLYQGRVVLQAVADHPHLVGSQPGIILNPIKRVGGCSEIYHHPAAFGSRVLRDLGKGVGDEVVHLPGAETNSQQQGEE